ncbi:MAG: hypothetical protein DI538_18815 [Azospira oryzae]|nr:MAG: hypothetical protein DI538_18815 [Azospira oryzae]
MKNIKLLFLFIFLSSEVLCLAQTFRINYDTSFSSVPLSGRLYLMLERDTTRNPLDVPDRVEPEPFFAIDVKYWKPGDTVIINSRAEGFPCTLDKLPRGVYGIAAAFDINEDERISSWAEGNFLSRKQVIKLENKIYQIFLIRKVPFTQFNETDRYKEIVLKSSLLSNFYNKSVFIKAAVILPPSYFKQPNRSYPTVYIIPGFSGRHYNYNDFKWMFLQKKTLDKIYVILDPDGPLGNHVFADSENNGPRGKSLIEEVIPAIEKQYRCISKADARFLTGHSSGGWSSLWLQVNYPDFFGGVWSTAPDPVDFRSFHNMDIYDPKTNVFLTTNGSARLLDRATLPTKLTYQDFSNKDSVVRHGGQLGSFESVFSPRGQDGQPKKLWNRYNGSIDPEVAAHWKNYDIGLFIQNNWSTIGPKLKGKIHVYVGDQDLFYLDKPVEFLRKILDSLRADAEVEIVKGYDHGSLIDSRQMKNINQGIDRVFTQNFPK